jgi:hypothetical protein
LPETSQTQLSSSGPSISNSASCSGSLSMPDAYHKAEPAIIKRTLGARIVQNSIQTRVETPVVLA